MALIGRDAYASPGMYYPSIYRQVARGHCATKRHGFGIAREKGKRYFNYSFAKWMSE
ncbi:MAG: hypothetical protein ABJE99_15055 [Roseobacter sp.]